MDPQKSLENAKILNNQNLCLVNVFDIKGSTDSVKT